MLKPSVPGGEACAAVEALAAETARRRARRSWSARPGARRAVEAGQPLRFSTSTTRRSLLDGGKIQALHYKARPAQLFSVFDEKRVFKAGPLPGPVNFRGACAWGCMVCEDMWGPGCGRSAWRSRAPRS